MLRYKTFFTLAFGATTALLIGITLMTPHDSAAGEDVWTSNGPYGGPVRRVVINPIEPNIMYAAVSSVYSYGYEEYGKGVFKSTDGGETWHPSNTELTNLNIVTIAVDPKTPKTLYAGTSESSGGHPGLFKSINGGESWTRLESTLEEFRWGRFYCIAIDPDAPATLYVAGERIFRSTDGGATWMRKGQGQAGPELWGTRFIAIDPTNPRTLYAIASERLFQSTDGGDTWRDLSRQERPEQPPPLRFYGDWRHLSIVIDPKMPKTLYVTMGRYGLYKSTDGGETWTQKHGGLPELGATGDYQHGVVALALDPKNPLTVYAASQSAGVYKSVDASDTWKQIGLKNALVQSITVHPDKPSNIYAASNGGIFQSADGGQTWKPKHTGISNLTLNAIVSDPKIHTILYAGSNFGVHKSTDGGESWVSSSDGLTGNSVLSLLVDPGQVPGLPESKVLYAGAQRGVFKSVNAGENWTKISNGLLSYVAALHLDKVEPQALYVGAVSGVYKSVGGGNTWQGVNGGLPEDVRVYTLMSEKNKPNVFYAGATRGAFKSVDSGQNWNPLGRPPFPEGQLWEYSVPAIVLEPENPMTLYIGAGYRGLYKSVDGGETWTLSSPARSVTALAIDPDAPSIIYAGTTQSGVMKSIDGGINWISFNKGLPFDARISNLFISPQDSAHLYAATSSGVFSISQSDKRAGPPPPEKLILLDKVTDGKGDAPEGHFDILEASVYTVGEQALQFQMKLQEKIPTDSPAFLEYLWMLDTDGNPNTGMRRWDIGAEYHLRMTLEPGFGWRWYVHTFEGRIRELGTFQITEQTLTVTVPLAYLGSPAYFDWVASTARDRAPDVASGSVAFRPIIAIAPKLGPTDTTVTISGKGFEPKKTIRIDVGEKQEVKKVATDDKGSFTTSLKLQAETAGSLTLRVTDVASGDSAEATFTVIEEKEGVISTVAGNGQRGFGGDGGPAIQARLSGPQDVYVDADSNIFISDASNGRIRRVDAKGIISIFAGDGGRGFGGDGGKATKASLSNPTSITGDSRGNIYILDAGNLRIRQVNKRGIITTVAGNGDKGIDGDGGPAVKAGLGPVYSICVDAKDNLYIAGMDRIRRVDTKGKIDTVVGGGKDLADGVPALKAQLQNVQDVHVDKQGNIYFCDRTMRVRRVGKDNKVTTVAGQLFGKGFGGDGGPATGAMLYPHSLSVDGTGAIFIASDAHNRIRRVDRGGIINTVVGTGRHGYNGEYIPALQANLGRPMGIFIDRKGNLFLAEPDIARVRRVTGIAVGPFSVEPSANLVLTTWGRTKTALYQNYPNPFNPETWIPYRLAKSADVTIHIHSVTGQLVRRLKIGRQDSGEYMSKSKAAHWDGRNDVGERIASGVYFYRIQAGDFTATRKLAVSK